MGLRKWTQADGGARLGKCAKLTSIAMSRVDERPPVVDVIPLQQPFARTLAISGECLLHLASLLGQVHMDRRGGVELVHECAEPVLVDRTNAVWSDADAEQ